MIPKHILQVNDTPIIHLADPYASVGKYDHAFSLWVELENCQRQRNGNRMDDKTVWDLILCTAGVVKLQKVSK